MKDNLKKNKEDDLKKNEKMEDNLKKTEDEPINLIGCDTIVNSHSFVLLLHWLVETYTHLLSPKSSLTLV
jgi:hypothetical protein